MKGKASRHKKHTPSNRGNTDLRYTPNTTRTQGNGHHNNWHTNCSFRSRIGRHRGKCHIRCTPGTSSCRRNWRIVRNCDRGPQCHTRRNRYTIHSWSKCRYIHRSAYSRRNGPNRNQHSCRIPGNDCQSNSCHRHTRCSRRTCHTANHRNDTHRNKYSPARLHSRHGHVIVRLPARVQVTGQVPTGYWPTGYF